MAKGRRGSLSCFLSRAGLAGALLILHSATFAVAGDAPGPVAAAPKAGAGVFDPDAPRAASELARRLLQGKADAFSFEAIAPDSGRDVFEIETVGGKVVIRGNSGVSMAMGLNWYLKHHCRCHVSLWGSQLKLPDELPVVDTKVRKVSWARYRYFLNYCCFGYSLSWFDWDQWQRLIDWMALNGVNMPLSVTGQEAVWQAVCKRLGMTDQQVRDFLAGPPYLPFQWMGCLDGWGGPLPDDWIGRHEALGKKILARQRQLGMTPVQQGFTGHVPAAMKQKYPKAKFHTIKWIEWQTHLLDPLDPLFARIADLWMQEQHKRFGTSHLYATDTFIEMTPPSGEPEYLANLSRAIYNGMARHDPKAVWVLQTWTFLNQRKFWTQPRIAAFLDAVPNEHMICLDLACEDKPQWSRTQAFCGKPWLWCNIQNYGNKIFLGGALGRIVTDLPAARANPLAKELAGLGFVNEGLDYNPIIFDLMYEMPWRDEPVALDAWVKGYATHRYGQANADAHAAWKLLLQTVYGGTNRTRSAISRKPTLGRLGVVSYDKRRLAEAWRHLLAASDVLGDVDTYQYDVVNVGRQVLVNHAGTLHGEIVKAWQAKDANALNEATGAFLRLISDVDDLLATREEFLLGRWLADARRWGKTDAERARMEWNARRVLTLWGEGPAIDDYASKDWSGLLNGFYRKGWEMYLSELAQSLKADRPFDRRQFNQRLRKWMADWSSARHRYAKEPKGDSAKLARKLFDCYAKGLAPQGSPSDTE